jgi:hypothetical protein
MHPALILCHSCIPEKGGINQKGINKNKIFPSEIRG